jgi:hypothetical protein
MNNENDVEMNPSDAGDLSDSQFGDEKEQPIDDDAKASNDENAAASTRRRSIIVAIGILAICIAAIVLGVVLTENDSKDPNQSTTTTDGNDVVVVPTTTTTAPVVVDTPVAAPATTAAPGGAPVSREDYLRNTVTPWSGVDALADADSAASKALDWLLHTDPMQLTTFKGVKEVQQRYIPAVLYYATNGPFWSPSRRSRRDRDLQVMNFLSGQNVCNWNIDGSDGIVCNDAGDITELQFGTKTRCMKRLLSVHKTEHKRKSTD